MDSSNKRISIDDLSKGGSGAASSASKPPPPKSKLVRDPGPEASEKAVEAAPRDGLAKVKLGVAVACLAVAAVLLAQNFGLIQLWGGEAPPPPPTEEEQQYVQEGAKRQQQREQEWQALPEAKRPPKAGS